MIKLFVHKRNPRWVGLIEIPNDPNERMGNIIRSYGDRRLLGRIGRWAFDNFNMYPMNLETIEKYFVDLL